MTENKFAIDEENTPALVDVTNEGIKKQADVDKVYTDRINALDKEYKGLASQYDIDENDGKTTSVERLIDAQNDATEHAVWQIEQQKEQSKLDYEKEQSAAYTDWKKKSDSYGTDAERRASAGLTSTGYAESTQAQMYSDYQARLVSAREVYKKAEINFNNAISNAYVQNSLAIAQIGFDALQKQSEIALAGFTAKQGLISEWARQKLEVEALTSDKYKMVLDQLNHEMAMQEEHEQFYAGLEADKAAQEADLAWKTEQNALDRQAEKDYREKSLANDNYWKQKSYELELAEANKDDQYAILPDDTDQNNPVVNNVASLISEGKYDVVESVLAQAKADGEINAAEYHALYFECLTEEINSSPITTEEQAKSWSTKLTKDYNDGRITKTNYEKLSKYVYSGLGTAVTPSQANYEFKSNTNFFDGNAYLFGSTASKNTIKILNGASTGHEEKTPAEGTVVRYNGKTYAYIPAVSFFQKTKPAWREIKFPGGGNPIGEKIDKYNKTHYKTQPEYFSPAMTEDEFLRSRSRDEYGTYEKYLSAVFKQ